MVCRHLRSGYRCLGCIEKNTHVLEQVGVKCGGFEKAYRRRLLRECSDPERGGMTLVVGPGDEESGRVAVSKEAVDSQGILGCEEQDRGSNRIQEVGKEVGVQTSCGLKYLLSTAWKFLSVLAEPSVLLNLCRSRTKSCKRQF